MKSERIRYRVISPEVLDSVQTFNHPTNGAQYKIRLNSLETTWYILDANTELVAISGYFKTKAKGQIAAKKALEALGVVFENGRRNRIKVAQVA